MNQSQFGELEWTYGNWIMSPQQQSPILVLFTLANNTNIYFLETSAKVKMLKEYVN